jgi:hypothetical protein
MPFLLDSLQGLAQDVGHARTLLDQARTQLQAMDRAQTPSSVAAAAQGEVVDVGACIPVYVRMCLRACMGACESVRLCLCACARVCARVSLRACACVLACVCGRVRVCALVPAPCGYVWVWHVKMQEKYESLSKHSCIHTHTHKRFLTFTQMLTHTHTHIHTRTHNTHAHTRTQHTLISVRPSFSIHTLWE